MAKKPDTNESGQTESGKKSGGGIAGLAIVAAASLASSFGLFYFLTPPAPPPAAPCPPAAEGAAAPAIKPLAQDQVYVEMKEILITIGSAPATRYLKLNVTIVTGKDNAAKVKQAEPMLIDAFNNYLRSIELSDLEDPGFYPHLREQLARRSELVVGSAASSGVLITEFLLR
ncbi:flagellar basal body-associated FliL family protein [Hyphomonas sp. NPDC076900]|uniref:flagellar basal body-associated FliL family protein n=1 Tax=unclassified Hyphomonas TaxID=2630699 RepID=UPI003D0646BF